MFLPKFRVEKWLVCKIIATLHLPLKHNWGMETFKLFSFFFFSFCSLDKLCFVNAQVQSLNQLNFFMYLKSFYYSLTLILKFWYFVEIHCFTLCIFVGSLHINILDYMQIQSVLPLSVEVQVWSSQYRTSSVGVRRTVLCIILDCVPSRSIAL